MINFKITLWFQIRLLVALLTLAWGVYETINYGKAYHVILYIAIFSFSLLYFEYKSSKNR